ncbi:MAG: Coenzyme F420 hydrogenase/dehydrogenase, beta subunit C-terminal domain [Acidobacteriota bacterium]
MVLGIRNAGSDRVWREQGGQRELQDRVVGKGLCTGCGACIGLCPYHVSHENRIVFLHSCEVKVGRCYTFCPRAPTDLDALRGALFERADLTPEIGAVRGFYIARAADPRVRETAQHGGTVSALVALALKDGMIHEAILTNAGEDLLTGGVRVTDPERVSESAGSRFVVSPALGFFNRLANDHERKIGIVTTPCQTLSLGKMRLQALVEDSGVTNLPKLVIGLFCGWAFSWGKLLAVLNEKVDMASIIGMDIPPSRYHSLEIRTHSGRMEIPLDEVSSCVREACRSCFDMTAEFSDLSVGSARLPEGWEEARQWNQVVVRTRAGEELLALAKSKGILEFRDIPAGNLERLKRAAVRKKVAAVRNLIRQSGKPDDWIYLDSRDSVFATLKAG